MNHCNEGSCGGNNATALNRNCFCRTLDPVRLREQLENDSGPAGLMQRIAQTRPHLFSSTVVFLSRAMVDAIDQTIAAIERVIALPAYRAQALARAPAIAGHDFGPLGVCMGFDFHIEADGPRLIEINTNAGGILLNHALAHAQENCCTAMNDAGTASAGHRADDDSFFAMFMEERRMQRGDRTPGRLLIVDDDPAQQYLAPEFELFEHLFRQRGIDAAIADARQLEWRDGRLWHGTVPVDMVYNRLTDFYLESPDHAALRAAYEAGAIVLTPHPRAHALYADKRNLIALSDPALLLDWRVAETDRQLLAANIPATQAVTIDNAERLWAARRNLFFKPVAGYAGKAAYRGDKLTRRVWSEILAGAFMAQTIIPPTGRLIEVDGALTDLKFDIRAYTYAGQIQLLAARMYTGQTTNFRTAGGGFAPVVTVT